MQLTKIVDGLQNIIFRDYFLDNEALNFPRDCSICLNHFVNEEELVQLKNCDHIFHKVFHFTIIVAKQSFASRTFVVYLLDAIL